jgi:hypothetical protein
LTKTKFISFLNEGLYLSKVTKFNDDWEGILPYLKKDIENNLLNIKSIRQALEWVYAICWYYGEDEDIEMWDEYGKDNEAIAIQTTAHNLQYLFFSEDRKVQSYFDYVSYKDPDVETFKRHRSVTVLTNHLSNEGYPQLIFSSLFSFYKNVKHKKDNEIRLAIIDSNACLDKDNPVNGILLNINNKEAFLVKIIIGPRSSKSYKDEIQSLLKANNIKMKVVDSKIKL